MFKAVLFIQRSHDFYSEGSWFLLGWFYESFQILLERSLQGNVGGAEKEQRLVEGAAFTRLNKQR